MVKLSLGSWLGSSNSSNSRNNDADRKKENRRSFAGFSSMSTSSGRNNKANGMNKAPSEKSAPGQTAAAAATKHTDLVSSSGSITTKSENETNPAAPAGQASSASTNMTQLADTISRETARLEKYLQDNGLPMPSFDVDAADDFPRLPDDMQRSRLEIIHATKQLRDLTIGPRESVRWGVWEVGPHRPLPLPPSSKHINHSPRY